MSGGNGLVFPLLDNQLLAADPEDNVWLSASAGTGKTQVLSARVLRLLLREDVSPSQILCLTFTKAGAAEMANRINAVLARWVRLPATTLAKELGYLGADIGPATLDRARVEEIASFARERDLIVLADEIYTELTYEGERCSIASLPGMRERTVFLHGFS